MPTQFADYERLIRTGAIGVVLVLATGGVVRHREAVATAREAATGAAEASATRNRRWSVDSVLSAAEVAGTSRAFGQTPARQLAAQRPRNAVQLPQPEMHLVLRGVLGGPPWSVVIAGLPSHPGTVLLRHGDTVGGLALVKVARDTAVLRGGGRTHVLTWAP